jgi:hypothetical protein
LALAHDLPAGAKTAWLLDVSNIGFIKYGNNARERFFLIFGYFANRTRRRF